MYGVRFVRKIEKKRKVAFAGERREENGKQLKEKGGGCWAWALGLF